MVWVDTMRLAMKEKEMSGICNKVEAKVVKSFVRGLVERSMMEEEVCVIAL